MDNKKSQQENGKGFALPLYSSISQEKKVFDAWLVSVLPKYFHSDQMLAKPTAKKRVYKLGLVREGLFQYDVFKLSGLRENQLWYWQNQVGVLKLWKYVESSGRLEKRNSKCLWKAGNRGKIHQLHLNSYRSNRQ